MGDFLWKKLSELTAFSDIYFYRQGGVIMRTNVKKLIFSIGIPLIGGGIIGFITTGAGAYEDMVKPPLSPPGWVFPVVWSILYIMMGIALYLVLISPQSDEVKSLSKRTFASQLIINFLWPVIFFILKTYWAAVVTLGALIILVVITIVDFRKSDKRAALVLVPYLIWCLFALYLNIGVAVLN